MGTTPSVTNTFVAGTKAKAAQANTNFTDIVSAIGSGTADIFTNSWTNRRLSNGTVNIGEKCLNVGFFAIDSSTTYTLNTTTSRMVVFGDLEIKNGGTLSIATSGAKAIIL